MKRSSNTRRWLLGAAVALGVLVLLFVIDIATGAGFSLYGWQVPVTVRVVDASTGATIKDATVSYGFSFAERPDYKPVDALTIGPITSFEIRMIYCRAEGGIFTRFRGPAHPMPSMYRFEFAAAGFVPQRVEGTVGELVVDLQKPSREGFVLRLPEVKLQPLRR